MVVRCVHCKSSKTGFNTQAAVALGLVTCLDCGTVFELRHSVFPLDADKFKDEDGTITMVVTVDDEIIKRIRKLKRLIGNEPTIKDILENALISYQQAVSK